MVVELEACTSVNLCFWMTKGNILEIRFVIICAAQIFMIFSNLLGCCYGNSVSPCQGLVWARSKVVQPPAGLERQRDK
jgi:hypothetical protein